MKKIWGLWLVLVLVSVIAINAYADQKSDFAVLWFNKVYYGALEDYSGDLDDTIISFGLSVSELLDGMKDQELETEALMSGTLPDNTIKIFRTDASYQDGFCIIGTVQQDHFIGSCLMIRKDSECVSVNFDENGQLSGNYVIRFADHSFSTGKVNEGIPYGFLKNWDKDNILTSQEWYYRGSQVQSWKETACAVEYQELFSNERDYLQKTIKLEGIVKSVFASGEYCYVVLTDDKGNDYIIHYPDTSKKSVIVPYVMTPETGERVDVTAQFEGIQNIKEKYFVNRFFMNYPAREVLQNNLITEEQLSYFKAGKMKTVEAVDDLPQELPWLSMVSCICDEKQKKISAKDDYYSVCKFPNQFWKEKKVVKGTVIYQSEDKKTLLVENDSCKYYLVAGKEDIENDYLNKKIRCSGILYGLDKLPGFDIETAKFGYYLFPFLRVADEKKITVKEG